MKEPTSQGSPEVKSNNASKVLIYLLKSGIIVKGTIVINDGNGNNTEGGGREMVNANLFPFLRDYQTGELRENYMQYSYIYYFVQFNWISIRP